MRTSAKQDSGFEKAEADVRAHKFRYAARQKYSVFQALALAAPLLAGCARGPLTGPAKPPTGTFTFASSKGEIEEGYEAYYEALAPYGTWLPEASWGVRFCPTIAEHGRFRPYVDGGRWSAERPKQASVPGAGNPESPYWVVDEGAPEAVWTDITTHHGWWVNYEAEQRFCWVPGTQATDGRVVWRAGNGFVGWAPEPPAWVDDGGDSGLPWVFTFLASLYFPAIGDDCIGAGSPEYERVATVTREVQRPQRDSDAKATGNRKSVISRRGPGRGDVDAAKSALAAFAATGPALPAPKAFSDREARPTSPSSSSDSGTDATSDAAKKKKLVVVVEEDLRPSLILPYLLVNPPQGRFLPNLFAPSAAALDVRSVGGGAVAVEESRPAVGSSSSSSNTRSWEGPSAASSSSAAMSSVSRSTTTKSAASSSSSSSSSSRTRAPTPETSKASTVRPTVSVGRR